MKKQECHTRSLLGGVAGYGAGNAILITGNTVLCALNIAFSLSGLVFSLALRMLLLSGSLPRLRTGQVADLMIRSQ